MKYINIALMVFVSIVVVGCGTKNLPEVNVPVVDNVVDTVKDVAGEAVDTAGDVVDAAEDAVDTVVDAGEELVEEGSEIVDIRDTLKDRNEISDTDDTDSETGEEVEEGMVDSYMIDTQASKLYWKVEKVVPGKGHYGTVVIKEGSVSHTDGTLEGATAVMDMTTITSEVGDSLDGHLKNEDFFDVANHPESSITITSIVDGTATADLTIKGITNEITFPITTTDIGADATFEIDRTLWDIKYGSATFFDDLADKAIEDTITFTVNVVYK